MNKRLTKNSPQMTFREIFANYGYKEGVERILAKQIQQILEREKQPNLAPAVAQSYSQ